MEKDVSDYFYGVKEDVSTDYKDLAYWLGIPWPDTRNIESKSTNPDAKSCCMDVLQTWKREKGNQATVEVLKRALISAGLQSAADNLRKSTSEGNSATSSQDNEFPEMAENVIASSENGGLLCRIRNFYFSCSERVWIGLFSTIVICVCVFLILQSNPTWEHVVIMCVSPLLIMKVMDRVWPYQYRKSATLLNGALDRLDPYEKKMLLLFVYLAVIARLESTTSMTIVLTIATAYVIDTVIQIEREWRLRERRRRRYGDVERHAPKFLINSYMTIS